MRLALVTRDNDLAADLNDFFSNEAIPVAAFACELQLFRAMRTTAFDLVMIDAKSNAAVLNSLLSWRNCNADLCTPVIVLTPFTNCSAMLRWVHAGATDVANRLDLEQVRLRVHMALRQSTDESSNDTIVYDRYLLRRDVGTLMLDGKEVPLTPREFAMAWLFFSHPGKFLSRAQIAGSVWGAGKEIASRSIEQHIYKLRKKLRLSSRNGVNLKTVYSLGYKLGPAVGEQPPDR